MFNLDDLLYGGSIMISMNKEGKIKGSALLRFRDGYVPLDIDASLLEFIYGYKRIIDKLRNGNKLYCYRGRMYIGYQEFRGPYAEEDMFISFSDTNNMSFAEMVYQIDNKLSKSDVRRLELTKNGAFYVQMSNKK